MTAAADVTHPAFYLDGQEVTAGNMRAFWALDPCLQTGTTCSTGDQCCTGFCRQQTEDDGGDRVLLRRRAHGVLAGEREVHDVGGLLRGLGGLPVHQRVLLGAVAQVIVARARGVG